MAAIKKLTVALVCCVVLSGLVYYLIFTTSGSQFLIEGFLSKRFDYQGMDYKNVEGDLQSGITYENLELTHLKNLPEGSVLRIQRLFFGLNSLTLDGIIVECENTRLLLPDSHPIVLKGSFKNNQVDANIHSKGFTVNEVLSYLPDFKMLVPIQGDLNEIDLYVTGHYLEPRVKGRFMVEKFIYQGFILSDAPLDFDLELRDIRDDIGLFGRVNISSGKLNTKKALVNLKESHLLFSGPWNKPALNIKGASKVEKTKIDITLKGTIEKPELSLSSEPPLSREKLMVMLATGKSWQSVENTMEGSLNSAALTKDFVDYFFFSGKTNQFAKKFGISDFSVSLIGNSKGISAKKELGEKVEVGYGVEQSSMQDQSSSVSQKIEGEYKLNERLSVGLEREIIKNKTDDATSNTSTQDDSILLKYKKSF